MKKREKLQIQDEIQVSDVIVQVINQEGMITFVDGMEYINVELGCKSILDKSISEVYKEYPEIVINIEKALSGSKFSQEHTLDGVSYAMNFSPMKHDGAINGVLMVWIDVTERRKTQAKILQSELRFRTLFDVASDAIFMMDNKTFVDCNEATLKVFRCEPHQIIGETPYRFSPPTQPDGRPSEASAMEKINGALAGMPQFFEWQHVHYDGTPFDAEVSLNRIDIGEDVYIQAIVRDVTERKQAEAAIKKKNEELVQINEELDRFVYSASHDLRAPIASLLGLVSILRVEKDYNKIKELVNHQEKSLLRLDQFIEDIVDYSRNKRLKFEVSLIDFEAEFKEAFEQLNFMEDVGKIETRVEVKGQQDFYTDKRRIKIIFNNLFSNAIKYADLSKRQPYIHLEVNIQNHEAEILVRDNGEGISEDSTEKLFDMFYRASNKGAGSGLGLYIVKDAVEKLGGRISVHSDLHKGTDFIIRLPDLRASQSNAEVT